MKELNKGYSLFELRKSALPAKCMKKQSEMRFWSDKQEMLKKDSESDENLRTLCVEKMGMWRKIRVSSSSHKVCVCVCWRYL